MCSSSFAQNIKIGQYYCRGENTSFSYNIDFFSNQDYMLDMSEKVLSDFIETYIVSVGKFYIKKNIITLIDHKWDFTMQAQIQNDGTIMFVSAFPFIQNQIFEHFSYNNSVEYDDYLTFKYQYCFKIRIPSELKQQKLHQLFYGLYEDEYNTQYEGTKFFFTHHSYELYINHNLEYTLKYKNLLVSKGTWSRDGNVLILFDENLQHSFYLIITEKGLKSRQYLPIFHSEDYMLYNKSSFSSNNSKKNTNIFQTFWNWLVK